MSERLAKHWVLDGQEVREADMFEWARQFEDSETRRVAQTQIGDVEVSTVFLGLDHRLSGKGPPLIFETMIFGGAHSEEQWRYPTWATAEAGHARIVAALQAGIDP